MRAVSVVCSMVVELPNTHISSHYRHLKVVGGLACYKDTSMYLSPKRHAHPSSSPYVKSKIGLSCILVSKEGLIQEPNSLTTIESTTASPIGRSSVNWQEYGTISEHGS